MLFKRLRSECGETLVETMASVLIVGIFVVSLYTFSLNVLSAMGDEVLNEQALAYGKFFINQIRYEVLQNNIPTNNNTIVPLPPADGAKFTAEWTYPAIPAWLANSNVSLTQYLVTIIWEKPDGEQGTLRLQYTTYPNADTG